MGGEILIFQGLKNITYLKEEIDNKYRDLSPTGHKSFLCIV